MTTRNSPCSRLQIIYATTDTATNSNDIFYLQGDEDRPHRNSTPRDVTQNAESQDRSAKSQNSDDLNVEENLQVCMVPVIRLYQVQCLPK
jgi:hypothetical protein